MQLRVFQDDSPCQAPARVGKELLLLPTASHSTATLIVQKREKKSLNIWILYILKYVCFYKRGFGMYEMVLSSVCDSKTPISTAGGLPCHSTQQEHPANQNIFISNSRFPFLPKGEEGGWKEQGCDRAWQKIGEGVQEYWGRGAGEKCKESFLIRFGFKVVQELLLQFTLAHL